MILLPFLPFPMGWKTRPEIQPYFLSCNIVYLQICIYIHLLSLSTSHVKILVLLIVLKLPRTRNSWNLSSPANISRQLCLKIWIKFHYLHVLAFFLQMKIFSINSHFHIISFMYDSIGKTEYLESPPSEIIFLTQCW